MLAARTWKGAGLADISRSIQCSYIALYFAWSDTVARYRRSVLGPFWITLSTAIGVIGIGFFWGELLKIERKNFIPSLTAGLIIWQFLSGCIVESAGILVKKGQVIRNLKLPYFIYTLQLVLRHLINLAHNFVVYIAVAILLAVPVTWYTWLILPGIILVILNLLWISLLFSMLGARFRDIEYALTVLIPLLFFVSPVLYRTSYLSFRSALVWLNPLTYFIEIIRDPLLGVTPPSFVYFTVSGMLALGWGVTLYVFNSKHHRIAFWV